MAHQNFTKKKRGERVGKQSEETEEIGANDSRVMERVRDNNLLQRDDFSTFHFYINATIDMSFGQIISFDERMTIQSKKLLLLRFLCGYRFDFCSVYVRIEVNLHRGDIRRQGRLPVFA